MDHHNQSNANASPPLVSLRNVGKRFANGTLALQGMSLDMASTTSSASSAPRAAARARHSG